MQKKKPTTIKGDGMLNVEDEKIQEIVKYSLEHGIIEASEIYDIKPSTIERYERECNQRGVTIKNILIFDIETAPVIAYVWGLWKQTIPTNHVIEDWSILCWAAKWLGESEIFTGNSWDKGKVRDDKQCCKGLADLLDKAHIVVAHNGDKFDVKRLNTRLLYHGIKQPSPFKSVDTLKIAKSKFSISSNRLDYIGKYLNIGRKLETSGFKLWQEVLSGCKESQQRMLDYNIGDVNLLEQVYLALRPWDSRHPNVNIQFNDRRCPVCGSKKLKKIDDVYTPVNKFSAHVCKECGKYSRTAQPMKTRKHLDNTQRNIT